jgi:hypothetical protein
MRAVERERMTRLIALARRYRFNCIETRLLPLVANR